MSRWGSPPRRSPAERPSASSSLDEPTTGLHFDDVAKLMRLLLRLRDQGNTIIVIEHNIDVIRCADWIVDLGPGGGDAGGTLVCEGPVSAVKACKASFTGRFL